MARIRSEQGAWPAVLIGAIVLMLALIAVLGLTNGAQVNEAKGFNLTLPPLPDVKMPWTPKLPTGGA